MLVNELMVDGEKIWDVDRVFNLFSDAATNDILATPLFDTVQGDKAMWIEERHGI
jgi:hypothetical protein